MPTCDDDSPKDSPKDSPNLRTAFVRGGVTDGGSYTRLATRSNVKGICDEIKWGLAGRGGRGGKGEGGAILHNDTSTWYSQTLFSYCLANCAPPHPPHACARGARGPHTQHRRGRAQEKA